MTARRIRRGRYWEYELDGAKPDAVTAVLEDGVPKPGLIDWAARTTAGYAVDHWDELVELPPSKRLAVLEKARWAEKRAAAARGTEVHRYAEALSAGETITVPDPMRGIVDACVAFLDEYDVETIALEFTVINRRYRYMGSADLLAKVAGEIWLLDWKTGAGGIFPETALQLAGYVHAETYLDGEDELELPSIDAAAAVWLRDDGYDVYPVDVSEETFRIWLYAQQIAKFRRAPRAAYVGEALPHPTTEEIRQ